VRLHLYADAQRVLAQALDQLDPVQAKHRATAHRTLRENPEGRAALAAVECGQLPQREIFKLTAAKLGLPPSGCLFVDDTEDNQPGAAELGVGRFSSPEPMTRSLRSSG
jgi:hypothetical protein